MEEVALPGAGVTFAICPPVPPQAGLGGVKHASGRLIQSAACVLARAPLRAQP